MNDKDWQPHEPVSRTEYVVNLERRVEELETALEETEHDMHMRIRASYDKTIADSWREHVKKIEAERDALAEKLKIKEGTIDLMGQFTETLQAEIDELRENSAKKLQEALANSDACWKLEHEMYIRQRDEARAEVERLRSERDHERTVANEQLARAHDAVRERDEARAEVSRRDREHEALVETAQKALAHIAAECDHARAEVERLRDLIRRSPPRW